MTSDGVLVVNFGSLQGASADIQRAVSELETKLADLEAAAKPLVATWESEAASAYQVRQAKWTQASNDLKAILNSIRGAVDESAADYLNTEKRATGLFQ